MLMATNYFVSPVSVAGRNYASRGGNSSAFGVGRAFPLLRDSDHGIKLLTRFDYTGALLAFTARREYDESPIISKSSVAGQVTGGNQFIDVHFLAADTTNLKDGDALIAMISAGGAVVYEFKLVIYV